MSKSKPTEAELKAKLNQVGKDISKLSADKKLSFDDALIRAERSLLMLYSEGLKTGFEHIDSHLNQVIETLDEVHWQFRRFRTVIPEKFRTPFR